MALIPIVSRWSRHVLFEFDSEPNTLRLTLEAAVRAQADLGNADLRDATLGDADLGHANLYGADLGHADLRHADLRNADLGDADLRNADLGDADLGDADLYGANLGDANLYGANLDGANLRDANMRDADLRHADLRNADLDGANLDGANLRDADLRDATNATLVQARTLIVPETGAFEAWKRCQDGILVHLRIPADALRCNAGGRKCRAQYVEVLEILGAEEAVSLHDGTTRYRVGATTSCDTWDLDRWNECSGGIHFYLTRIEAEHDC